MIDLEGDKDYLKKITDDPRLVEYYDLFKEVGILEEIDNLNKGIRNLEELLDEAVFLFNKSSIPELVNYVSQKMLSKFIPSYLAFIIQEEDNCCGANIICYKNMKPIETMITIESIDPYKKFFSLSPATIKFDAFRHMVDNEKLSDPFLPLDPELIVPMMGLDGMYGFLVFGKKIMGTDYSQQELNYIDKIMKFASVSLQNNIHYRKATVDSKTKLYNHSFFMRKLEEECARVKRYNSRLSVLIIDIDNFKRFNDAYGHLMGDRILFYISRLIAENIRKEDIAARFGGEEFVIMLVESEESGAFVVAEKLRKIVENFKIKYLNKEVSVTISLGVCTLNKGDEINPNELIRRADVALYKAKETGRNKTAIFDTEMEAEPANKQG